MRSLRSLHSFSIVAPAIALLCAPPLIGLAQDDLTLAPYSVFVAEEEAFAYCGPSEDYYRTDPLRYGQTLDVYAETEDGWLGIRPPEDSFCWIPADTVELDESQEEGIISEDRTVAWIGTHLGRARKYRWQVQLAKGEPVTIIGRSEREGPDGPQLWYRIVPPSGEYRWIHRDSVVMTSEELVESVRHRESEKEKPKMARSEPASRDSVTDSAREADIRQTAHVDDDSRRSEASGRDTDFSESVASSGPSVLDRDEAIGSGLNEDWRRDRASRNSEYAVQASAEAPQSALDAFKQGGLLASLEFMTRPQIQEIGGQPQTAPASNIALDSNWVAGASRTAGGQATVARSDPSNAIRAASSITSGGNPIIRYEAAYKVAIIDGTHADSSDLNKMEAVIEAHAEDQGDKAPGKAMSYAVKYFILKTFNIETGEDEESRIVSEDQGRIIQTAEYARLQDLIGDINKHAKEDDQKFHETEFIAYLQSRGFQSNKMSEINQGTYPIALAALQKKLAANKAEEDVPQ